MPSSPDSGPSSTSTFWLSTRRRASATALSGVASEQPNWMLIGCPPALAPLTVSCGLPPADVPPPSLTSAYLAPEKASASNSANGPPQVVRMPTLMGLPFAVVEALVVVAAPPAAVVPAPEVELPPPPELSLELLPHPAASAAAETAASRAWSPRRPCRHRFEPAMSTLSSCCSLRTATPVGAPSKTPYSALRGRKSIIDSRCTMIADDATVAAMRDAAGALRRRAPAVFAYALLAFAIIWV